MEETLWLAGGWRPRIVEDTECLGILKDDRQGYVKVQKDTWNLSL